MKYFVINLAKDVVRKNHMIEKLDSLNLDYEFIDAVYGLDITDNDMPSFYNAARAIKVRTSLAKSEIGCALSHIKIYQKIVQDNLPYAVILEDDVTINADINDVVTTLEKDGHLKSDTSDIIFLGGGRFRYSNWYPKKLTAQYKFVSVYDRAWGAYGYIITNAAARSLLTNITPIYTVIDYWDHYARNRWVSLKAVIPKVITISADGADSNIEVDRNLIGQHKKPSLTFSEFISRKIINNLIKKPLLVLLEKTLFRLSRTE